MPYVPIEDLSRLPKMLHTSLLNGRLSFQLVALSVLLLVLAVLSIGMTLYVTRQLDGGAAAVNEAGRLRMHAWHLSHTVDNSSALAERSESVRAFEASLSLLAYGDPKRPLAVPWDESTRAIFDTIQGTWSSLRTKQIDLPSDGTPHERLFLSRLVDETDRLILAIEGQLARLTAILNLFQMVMMASAVAAAIVCLYMGHLFVIQPLLQLRSALQRIEAGDFAARVSTTSSNEFDQVAAGFNHMATKLQSLYQELEQKVLDKTQDLESERKRLSALYEVSTFLAAGHDLETLAQGFAQKMRLLSGADAAAVRYLDMHSQRYLMLGSDCLPEALVREEHCLQAGSCGCGQPPAAGLTKVIPISQASQVPTMLCAEAGYANLISVPIRLQHSVLGEVDLFYRGDVSLSKEERLMCEALTGHFAVTVETLRTEALSREAAVSEERLLLARELHDSIAQSLAFLNIQVGLLRQGLGQQDMDTIQTAVNEIDVGVRESTQDVRELLVHFRTRTNSDDIEQALQTTVAKFEQQSGVKTHLEIQGHGLPLPSDVQLQVLHIVQEALTNVRKHAQASHVHVAVDKGPHWSFEVRDDGRGFRPIAANATDTHVGLHIMRERAERIGAQVHMHSAPGMGTKVTITLGS